MLANQLINDLEIQCSNRACDWTGKLGEIKSHLPNCTYRDGNLPKWFKEYVKQQEDELKDEEEKDAIVMPEEEYDLQMKNKIVPLAMRLFKPENKDNGLNAQLQKMVSKFDKQVDRDVKAGVRI